MSLLRECALSALVVLLVVGVPLVAFGPAIAQTWELLK